MQRENEGWWLASYWSAECKWNVVSEILKGSEEQVRKTGKREVAISPASPGGSLP